MTSAAGTATPVGAPGAGSFGASLETVVGAVRLLPSDVASVAALGDAELMAAQRRLADVRKAVDACSALVAGQIGERSRRELGLSGLAQREGFRTPEALVKHETGSTAREATTLVRIGSIVHEAQSEDEQLGETWLRAVGRAVGDGLLSVEKATAIRTGLGIPVDDGVSAAQLAMAALELLEAAQTLDADTVLKRAREMRDDLDEAGIRDRAAAIHRQRGIRRVRQSSGIYRYIVDPDLETSAFLDDLYDKSTSPRRGGPRFVSPEDKVWAEAVAKDERTVNQYVHDVFVQLLRIGVYADDTDSSRLVGPRLPAVRVLVAVGGALSTEATAEGVADDGMPGAAGHGRIEGIDVPVPIETVERAICSLGMTRIDFAGDQPLNVGREERLFTPTQRIALAARDGGCMWRDCDRPPSWCEAHHIKEWERDEGNTDVADGILLCRHHHLLLHDNGWRIVRDRGRYWLVPPVDIDATQSPRLLSSKSAALRDLHRSGAGSP